MGMVLVVLYFIYRAHRTTGKEITTRGPIYYGSGFSYALRAAQDAQRIDLTSLSRIAGNAAQIGLDQPKQRDSKLYRATPNSTTQHKTR